MANPVTAKHANHRVLLFLESVIHILAIGLVYINFALSHNAIPYFNWVINGLVVLSIVRIYIAHSSFISTDKRRRYEKHPDWHLPLSTFALGIAWACLAIKSSVGLDSAGGFIHIQMATIGIAIAIFVGSVMNVQQLTKFIITSFGIPIIWAIYSKHFDYAFTSSFALLTISSLAIAANKVDDLLERFSQVSRGNAELVRNLASTRDDALKAKAKAEKANEIINAEITERKKAERRIKLSEMELSRILNDMKDTYFRINKNGEVIRLSPSIEMILGYTIDEAYKMNWRDFFYTEKDYDSFVNSMDNTYDSLQNHEVRFRNKYAETVWVTLNVHRQHDAKSGTDGFEGIARNTTEARNAKDALYKEKELWRVALDSIADGIVTTDMNGDVKYLNPVAEEKTGWEKADAYNNSVSDIIQIVNEKTQKPIELPIDDWLVKGEKAAIQDPAVLIQQGKNGKTSIELIGSPILDARQRVIGSVMVFHDVTKLRALTNALSYQATHDKLTGLINRLEFDRLIEQAIDIATEEKQHAILYIDLDQFKIVNDTSGHPAGDELLIQITRVFNNSLREADSLARLGGDEFGVLLNGCSLEKAEEIAECLRKTTEEFRFSWEDKVFRIGASIGVVPITNNKITLTELLKSVDSACYVAKENGRNCVHVSRPDDKAVAIQHGQMQWMQRLQSALENNEFIVYAQPIKPIKEGLPDQKRYELLIRMVDTFSDEKGKVIQPSAFLPVAERYHLMPAIDRWLFSTALNKISSGESIIDNNTICSINLSGQSLSDMKVFNFIHNKFKETNVNPTTICFEITESAMVGNMEVAMEFINRLHDMGCKLALDDFGTALSSFDYIKQLPVDYVKLDKVLVKDVATSKVSRAMVQAISYIASVMDMQSIAEFVETDEIREALCELSVDYAQGYAIGKPVPFYTPEYLRDIESITESDSNLDYA